MEFLMYFEFFRFRFSPLLLHSTIMARTLKRKKILKKSKVKSKGASSSNPQQNPAKVWQPGVDMINEGEELQFDRSAYDCLHAFNVGWPCLSFDIIRDEQGLVRTGFPHSLYCVAGTQAEDASSNSIGIVRLSNISGKKRNLVPMQSDDNESESDSDSSSDEEDEDSKPVMQLRMVAHQGCVNRIRSMMQEPHICATWGENGYVQVWDFRSHLNSLAASDPEVSTGACATIRQAPLHIFTGHKDEGYALDWSSITPGRLLSGDCKSCIHLWNPTSGGKWAIDKEPFKGHSASVEDLQWSPTEGDVFASCSVDGRVAIWDARVRNQPAVSVKAHNSDVNVISWNRLASCMIASGSDDGSLSIWDLRSFKEDSFVAHFQYHKQPITSIEWSPHEASTLAVSSSDDQLTIWDLSLERDAEEEAEFKAKLKQQADAPEDLPPQLLFVHQGQKSLKELHWHGQIPGMLLSTAHDGFNVFIPSNVEMTLPELTGSLSKLG
ncbi:glutamate-rich WD repeat-containing protein 1 isoform X1 [Amborella trichopoda]|uniref:glutamate-rich WD repeat-containing protein 1 isoform X1 n=1 Tax=Amborella trichopoda TaxID=13333 RepID=UPI0009BD23CB|nr:glutamate-rich WD repeat-containing protein 1 isoform X1 [Amborella trichopoda]|eukprot:XP_020529985.1 glutamate-rich WD repeat-containing protein 1 isoform X1 [Amborella trichopoda]